MLSLISLCAVRLKYELFINKNNFLLLCCHLCNWRCLLSTFNLYVVCTTPSMYIIDCKLLFCVSL